MLDPDEPGVFGCGDCYRCVTACPTGALLGDGRLNAQVCLSFQTHPVHPDQAQYP
ncbi:4Fe-4S double cluster binding domain-containing protein [Jeotgalibaca porci]|uniref:4Fe-4S double cluster binding domain-containing protein n=1 Tax=Jeotgalibaca porci TaxID=1868793 RepID=UPI0035A1316B